MTLEELWELFPIVLVPHQPVWKLWADDEIKSLSRILTDFHPVIHHIGSTAIPDIHAKPIIDILIEIAPGINREEVKDIMERSSYICMSVTPKRMSFNKGYTPSGFAEKVFHIHVRESGDNDEIYFRNYLKENLKAAREYEALKLSLLPEYRHDRDGYTAAKTDFVTEITRRAKQMISRHP